MIAAYIAAALSLAGFGVSLYLTTAPTPEICEITSFFSCDKVLTSPYAKLLNIPTALYGAGWFAVASSTAILAAERKWAARFLSTWSVLGIAGVAMLIYVELVLINAVCLLCTMAHVLAVGVALLAVYINRRIM